MLTSSERHAVLLLAGVVAVLALIHFGVVFLYPDDGAVPYTNNCADGSFVTYSGVVEDITLTKTGGHLIVNVSGVPVFVPDGGTGLLLLRRDNVTLHGIVETYARKKEIIVKNPEDIRVV